MTDSDDLGLTGIGGWLPSIPGTFVGLDRRQFDEWMGTKPTADTGPPPPMPTNCIVCNHHNPYVGKEHLTDDGHYVCRTCKPGYERRRNLAKLAEEAERLRKKREEFG